MTTQRLDDAKRRMEGASRAFAHELNSVRTGRASTALLDRIHVDAYGVRTPLNQLATISAPEARMLTIQPYDRGLFQSIEKAIQESDLGLTPNNDGQIIRLGIPQLSEERRKEFVKIARKYGEECKVVIRKHRHEALDMLAAVEADGEASADEVDRGKKKAEEAVTEAVKTVDQIIAHKEKDILEV